MSEEPQKKTLNDRFVDIADWVSAAMGTPANIILWLLAVLAWFLLFAFNPGMQNSSFLPSWFTSSAFNFPLNSITTLAELYIGFLVAAAANRVEKHNRQLQEHQGTLLEKIESIEEQHERMLNHLTELEAQNLVLLTKMTAVHKTTVLETAKKERK